MHQQKETLHPLLERWISVMVALVGRLFYLDVNDKDTLRFVFRNFLRGIGVAIMLFLLCVLALSLPYLNEYLKSLK